MLDRASAARGGSRGGAREPREQAAVEELAAAEGELVVVTEPGALGAEATGEIEVTGLEAATEVNALSTVQAALAADPSDYSVSTGDTIQVQALETLGHYADWLELPTQRLRDLESRCRSARRS